MKEKRLTQKERIKIIESVIGKVPWKKFEAGIQLRGDEIKAIRAGKATIIGSYAKVLISDHQPEVYWIGGNFADTADPQRTRKLLLHRDEINKLIGKTREKGLTLIATKLYLKAGKAKLEIALCKGKKLHDKRESLKKKDLQREQQRNL